MYKVVVADDEDIFRRGLMNLVDWKKFGFVVVGEAANGADALEMVEQFKADLLITDIRMPILTGIELACELQRVRPMVSVVFLSGYEDFSYAQQALQYNVISYLLKPISAKTFETELRKIKNIIDKKNDEFLNAEVVKCWLEKTEFLYPLLLDGCLRMKSNEQEVRKSALEWGLLENVNEKDMRFSVLVIQIIDRNGINKTNRSHIEAIEIIVKKYMPALSCYLKEQIVIIIAENSQKLKKYIPILTEEIKQSVERILDLNCIIGVSQIVDRMLMCRDCYIEALNAIYYADNTESRIFFFVDEKKTSKYTRDEIQMFVEELERLLRGGTNEELTQFLNVIEKQSTSGDMPRVIIWYLTSQILSAVFKIVFTIIGDSAVMTLKNKYMIENIPVYEMNLLGFVHIKDLCFEAKRLISEQRKQSSNKISERVLQIIETQYMNRELSVQSVSARIGVSPNYLSATIKKDIGVNFVELLTKKRISKAKELLINSNMKIHEISEQCGYTDQYYFSHCFKKITGKSPGVYRKTNED